MDRHNIFIYNKTDCQVLKLQHWLYAYENLITLVRQSVLVKPWATL